ncbi:MAG: DUF2095 family protein [Candidatus Thorarchaeota archaeon]
MEVNNLMNQKKKNLKKPEIKETNGIEILYNEDEFNKEFPNLIKEISSKKKLLKIDSVRTEKAHISKESNQNSINSMPKELFNPEALDFIRRCTKKEEAIEILDYLLRRNEISHKQFNKYKKLISQEGGLERLIEQCGGLKEPGYYMKKYYKNLNKDQKLNNNKD